MDLLKPIREKLSKPLWEKIEAIEPHVSKDGDFHWLHSTFDGFKTFLFVPPVKTVSGAHIRDGIDLKRTMIIVVLAMIPCLLHGIFNVGHMHYVSQSIADGNSDYLGLFDGFFYKLWYGLYKVIPIVAVAYGAGLAVEFAFAQMRGHQINEGYLVSGMLIPLIMPPDIPLWMVAVASIFAVIIGKEAFGGTGMNILNVALTARVFLFFAYPTFMSGDEVWIAGMADGYSGATANAVLFKAEMAAGGLITPLAGSGEFFSTVHQQIGHYAPLDMILGFIPGSIGETSKIAILMGGLLLVVSGIGRWEIMVSMIFGALMTGVLFNGVAAIDPNITNAYMSVPAHHHLWIGSLLFAAVFMATDPVTAAQTQTGKYIYGFLIGVSGMIIRVLNPAYPEGWMLAILFMNVFAPLIDHVIIQSNIKRRLARG